jgi:hypothetical protein
LLGVLFVASVAALFGSGFIADRYRSSPYAIIYRTAKGPGGLLAMKDVGWSHRD